MNKKERLAAATLVAEWEWGFSGGSASEAAARAQCAIDLIRTLNIPESDLEFARSWKISELMGIQYDTDLMDALDDLIECVGYETVVDMIEESGFDGLRARLTR